MNDKILALITARGGSKGLPRKNLLDLNGLPLIVHTINSARESGLFSKVVVSTEDNEIKEISEKYGAEVIDRPESLARDLSSSLDVIEHALSKLSDEKFKFFCLLQPTSPLRRSEHIIEAWCSFCEKKNGSLVSVSKVNHSPYKMLVENDGICEPLFDYKYLTKPRQELPEVYMPNGAIYISSVDYFLDHKNLFKPPLSMYQMSSTQSLDIDTKADLEKCKEAMNAEY